jgi:hypothetical protein
MSLAALLHEIEGADGPLTIADLARRLGSNSATIADMLVALRAAGRLRPDAGAAPGTHECGTAGSCAIACPGPSACPFVLEMPSGLEVRARTAPAGATPEVHPPGRRSRRIKGSQAGPTPR